MEVPGTEPMLIEAGRRALARGAWGDARIAFSQALDVVPTIDGYIGLGTAARYLLDPDAAFAAHEAAFALARTNGDDAAAAWAAVQMAWDAYAFRGPAEASAWVERAAMFVADRPPSAASAFVPFARGYFALLARHDPNVAREESAQAVTIARAVAAADLEFLALALEGLSLVALGQVDDGMPKLDIATAAALGGEMTDADSIETVCCFLIDACKRVRDLERASEWCLRVREVAERFDDRQMFSVCRVHYADVLLWQGDLHGADREIRAAAAELGRIRPGREVDALVRQAELHRRHGLLDDAERVLAACTSHRLHALVEGHVAFERGAVASAIEAADRFLRRIGGDDLYERVAGLELAVRARAADGDIGGASAAADEIERIVARTDSAPLRASALLARGRIAVARSQLDIAMAALDDAADLFTRSGARFDAAQTLRELGIACRLAGREQQAARAEAAAQTIFTAMGVGTPPPTGTGELSSRETEVLRLVARGWSNEDIASHLVLSVRTVERHVANIYGKIGASGRTARAVATAWAHTHGFT